MPVISSRIPVLIAIMLLAVVAIGAAGAHAASQQSLESGALGLTRPEVEARWGAATEQIEMRGHPVYDETYAYGAEEGMTYVSYRDVNGVQIAVYVEFVWFGDGVTEQVAAETIEDLLPADAELTEIYLAPSTPDGPIALAANRYASESLGTAQAGVLASEILVI